MPSKSGKALILVCTLCSIGACDNGEPLLSDRPVGCREEGATEMVPLVSAVHVEDGTDVVYTSEPPSVGDHYGQWAAWGRHTELRAEYYVHNLEHGGITFLVNCPDACPEVEADLEAYARSIGPDSGGAFRWIMTERAQMETRVAAVAWGWVYRADCVNVAELDTFVAEHYRRAPEDVSSTGSHIAR